MSSIISLLMLAIAIVGFILLPYPYDVLVYIWLILCELIEMIILYKDEREVKDRISMLVSWAILLIVYMTDWYILYLLWVVCIAYSLRITYLEWKDMLRR